MNTTPESIGHTAWQFVRSLWVLPSWFLIPPEHRRAALLLARRYGFHQAGRIIVELGRVCIRHGLAPSAFGLLLTLAAEIAASGMGVAPGAVPGVVPGAGAGVSADRLLSLIDQDAQWRRRLSEMVQPWIEREAGGAIQ